MTDQQTAPSPGSTSGKESKSRTILSIRSVLAAVCCAVLLAAAAVAGPVAPAQAAGSCSLVVPSAVAVSRPEQEVILKLSSDCAARQVYGYASWNAYHPTRGLRVTAIFHWYSLQDYWEIYDWGTPLGVLTWRPDSCWDGAMNDCAQNSPRTTIKAGSQLGFTGTRAGSYRTLSVATAYYSPAVSAFRMWGNEKVQLQYKTCATCTWTYLRNVYTASNGRATYRTYSAHLRYYRAVSAPNSSIWGRTSAVILR